MPCWWNLNTFLQCYFLRLACIRLEHQSKCSFFRHVPVKQQDARQTDYMNPTRSCRRGLSAVCSASMTGCSSHDTRIFNFQSFSALSRCSSWDTLISVFCAQSFSSVSILHHHASTMEAFSDMRNLLWDRSLAQTAWLLSKRTPILFDMRSE